MTEAGTLYDRGQQLWHELAKWFAANAFDIAIAALIAAAIAAVLLLARRFGQGLTRHRDPDGSLSWRTVLGRVLAKTNLFFIILVSAKLVAGQAETPPFLQRPIDFLFVIAAAVQAAIWGRELIVGVVEHRAGEMEETGRLGTALGIIRLIVTIALFSIALVLILDNLGVDVTGLVAGLGIGGIAIGLAAQGIFSDLFAALSIIFDKPFKKGDTVTFGSPPTTGTVEEIGLKTTRIRSLTGEMVVISNANLLNQQLQNWAELRRRRAIMTFGVVYQTEADTLARVPLELQEIVEAQPLGCFDRCHAFRFGDSSIDFELAFFVESPRYPDYMAVQQAIILGMVRRFGELGIDFAYPTQTTFTAAPDGTMIMPYPEVQPVRRIDLKEGE